MSRSTPCRRHIVSWLAAIVALAALATGCSSTPDIAEARRYDDLADTCDPAMERALQAWVQQGFGGSIAALGGDRPCVIGLGVADRATGSPVTAATPFSIGSITKAVTAAAVLDLVDAGRLDLDDAAGDHVDGLTGDVRDLKIRHLLVHTSGLTGYHGQDHVPISKPDAVAAISDLGVSFDPGSRYSYTNAGYTLLALIVDAVSDQGFRRYVVDHILHDGTGRSIGGFWDGEPAVPGERAVGYLAGDVAGQMGDFAGPHWALDGNGGVAMTPLDMAAWTRALFSGHILSEEATDILTSLRKRHPSGEYELPGWVELPPNLFGEPVILASGGGGSIGHLMDVAWLPDTDRVIVVAQSATGYNTNDLLRHVADALVTGTGVPTPPPLTEADPAVMDRLVGRYRLDSGGEIIIEVDERDDRGLRVSTIGADAIATIFPLPVGYEAEIARHEEHALRLANGETAEGAALIDAFEAEIGPIAGVSIVASLFDGELITLLAIDIDIDSATDAVVDPADATRLVSLALNDQGGSEAISLDAPPPSRWFVSSPDDASFVMHRPSPENPDVGLRSVGDGPAPDLEITGPFGTRTAIRVG